MRFYVELLLVQLQHSSNDCPVNYLSQNVYLLNVIKHKTTNYVFQMVQINVYRPRGPSDKEIFKLSTNT